MAEHVSRIAAAMLQEGESACYALRPIFFLHRDVLLCWSYHIVAAWYMTIIYAIRVLCLVA